VSRVDWATMERTVPVVVHGDVVQNRGKNVLSRVVILATTEVVGSSCCARATAMVVQLGKR